jgi:(p)ppGpp synthase/HD superfamily hydrolase
MPTTSQVKQAGKILRAWARGELVDVAKLYRARATLLEFRAAHRLPLTTANMGLRSMVRTEGCRMEISQRLKRVPTIIDKLKREPTMQLPNMQDIGGVRSIVDTIPEVRRIQRRLSHRRSVLRVSDYIVQPRSSGYRSVHVVVEYGGRAIEVQLRTQVMHE